jgi:hypothetical protein
LASGIAPQQAFGHQRSRRISGGRNRQIYQQVTRDKVSYKIRWSSSYFVTINFLNRILDRIIQNGENLGGC